MLQHTSTDDTRIIHIILPDEQNSCQQLFFPFLFLFSESLTGVRYYAIPLLITTKAQFLPMAHVGAAPVDD